MSEETLLTAARRAVRYHNIDQAHGGSVSIDTLKAMLTLDIQIQREIDRQKREQNNDASANCNRTS